jgi:hypothetical protein
MGQLAGSNGILGGRSILDPEGLPNAASQTSILDLEPPKMPEAQDGMGNGPDKDVGKGAEPDAGEGKGPAKEPLNAEQKKAAEARKRQKVVEIKEIKLRPGIDDHDYETKMKAVRRFFEEGDKVKVTLRFRGRELAHQDLGYALLRRVRDETSPYAKVEAEPSMEGRQMIMVLAPK